MKFHSVNYAIAFFRALVRRNPYAFWGVEEYFQYDPTGDYLNPQLQGLRLIEGNYFPIPPVPCKFKTLELDEISFAVKRSRFIGFDLPFDVRCCDLQLRKFLTQSLNG